MPGIRAVANYVWKSPCTGCYLSLVNWLQRHASLWSLWKSQQAETGVKAIDNLLDNSRKLELTTRLSTAFTPFPQASQALQLLPPLVKALTATA